MKFKYLINDITVDFWSSWNFVSSEDIRRRINPKVNLSKFIFNKKNIELSCSFSLQPILLPKFCPKFNYVYSKKFVKKFQGGHKILFKDKKS